VQNRYNFAFLLPNHPFFLAYLVLIFCSLTDNGFSCRYSPCFAKDSPIPFGEADCRPLGPLLLL
jgi:hypothetical protein